MFLLNSVCQISNEIPETFKTIKKEFISVLFLIVGNEVMVVHTYF